MNPTKIEMTREDGKRMTWEFDKDTGITTLVRVIKENEPTWKEITITIRRGGER